MSINLVGTDFEGREFNGPDELWRETTDEDGSHNTWYEKAVSYWDKQEASYNGVLGGYGYVSDADVRESKAVIIKAMRRKLEDAAKGKESLVALDCGAGVGRVTRELLLQLFQEVDLLEPSAHLLDSARTNLIDNRSRIKAPARNRAVHFFCEGLQEHDFSQHPGRYHCIWIQWCLLYLTDDDVMTLMKQSKVGLAEEGIIFVKENICKEGFVVDNDDSSLTRSNEYMLKLFERANMQVLYNIKQRNFPKELFEVRMYVLRHRQLGEQEKTEAGPTEEREEATEMMQG
uniref:Alpha N-terminal protein methyltransferase 1 n=1 Tax=Polytomella parva TaxID=51329 RepID=A0A7S0YQQ1_9CHLO|mmetsp:Transcript_8235/g.15898  ORF Transcript_8235/g.15898 Transcript_8235/m.15898 type:complete len:288 (+) Transcript_8235:44-907(+)|eukprot:CAMPEP_0175063028 /NCGR_PEP_ID=MMETSP0052_2-20121109/14511_1 /TAXON_ID=51329 ORGANISM="Polytomella parva, Strain SAG 63-3" /NCGR_SAMPLE_ID=MMETSP0052_2 /ASSEMBLY_ACC=CAM_ASM_000194 /LENGTH=287 /DNA_ID=CAMNT_0016329145 /DNA_START=15 /DNA_END=878 /DNA_ORIENTATION=+